jgi:hypothetical protein
MLQKVMSHCAKLEHIEPRVGRNIPLLNGFFLGTTMQSLCADGFRLKLSHFLGRSMTAELKNPI